MRRTPKRLLALAAACGMLTILAVAAPAIEPGPTDSPGGLTASDRTWLKSHGPVRVGVPEAAWPPFDLVSEEGVHRGITPDYLDLVAVRAGFRVQRIRFKTFADSLAALERGEIDILGSITRTPARERFALFTAPYVLSPPVIIARKDDATIRDVKSLADRKVAIERGYAAQEFLRKEVPSVVFVEVATTPDALRAVAQGQAQAYVGSLVAATYVMDKNYLTNLEVRASAGFPTSELGFAVRKDLPVLARVVDVSLRGLTEADHDRIRSRWISARGMVAPGAAVPLTAAEQTWIRAHPRILLGVLINRAPLEIVDGDGRHSGITADYVALLRDRLGLEFDPVIVSNWIELEERFRKRTVDTVVLVVPTEERRAYLAFTRPFFSMPWVAVTATDAPFAVQSLGDLRGKRVAVLGGNSAHGLLRTKPEIGLVPVAKDADGLAAVAEGRADAMVAPLATIGPLIQQEYSSALKVAAPLPEVPSGFAIATRRDWPELRDVLDKAVASLTETEHAAIRNKWLGVSYRFGADWRRLLRVLLPIAATLGLVLLVIVIWNRRLQAQIVQRRKAEAALSDQLKFQEVLFDTVPSALFFKDAQGRYIGCNRAFEEMYGVTRGELMGKTMLELFPDTPRTEREALHAEQLRMLETRGSHFMERQARHADGKVHDQLYWARTFDLADGRVGGLLGAVLDITDRKEAERQLATQFRTLQTILEVMPDGAALVDRSLQVAASNEKFRTFLDLPRELFDDQGRASFEALVRYNVARGEYGAADPDTVAARVLEAVQESTPHHEERTRPDGTVLDIRGAPLPDGGFVRFYSDITERRRAEIALAEAKEAAVQANRAKSSFLATMSHEIRTPMNGVLGMLELLSLTQLEADQRATLSTARESARSLLGIIDDILDVSKIEAGRLELRPEPTALGEVVEGVFLVYSVAASSKNLLLMRTVDARISPTLVVDPLRLRQILNNFTSNAIKFTVEGHVEIRAELIERRDGRDVVRFSVADTGIGISPENQRKLFQPFVQAEADTTRRFGGTGLGLAICRRLAEMMDGAIEMQSEVGKGTTMTLTLALPIGDPALVRPSAAAGGPSAATAALMGRRAAPTVAQAEADGTLVLVVDDHPTNRSLLERQLRALGYAAESADNALTALERWRTGRFAVVVTDCHMPEMDGYDLARAIRAEEAARGARRMPVIACTANALAGEAEVCLAAGMDDYLAKPVEMAALAKALDRWLPLPAPRAVASAPAAAGQAGPAPIAAAALAELTGGDEAIEREILREYKMANDADVLSLEDALARRDLPGITRAAHRIKGASKMVGARDLAAVCAAIEQAGRGDDLPGVMAEEARLRRELERLNAYLDGVGEGSR
jgi:PAS domain S-box-containing protein